ncbi:MAG: amino acid ABC transporter permease [Lachnospiraceae bacterium]|nr:amino acid ABC transporter permease [Lachnospiraceae bacterium]
MDFLTMLEKISVGMLSTILIFALTLLFALPLGWIVAFGRMSKNKILSGITGFIISVLRGTPLMLQLMVVLYGPYFLAGISINDWRFPAIIIGFSINYAAYFAEIYRSGMNAIPVGQYEAAHILGYNKVQTFFTIILPQVIRVILPAVTNEVITLVKDTSLAFTVSYVEMFTIAKQIASANVTLVPFAVAALFYYVFNLLVSFVMRRLEKRLAYY